MKIPLKTFALLLPYKKHTSIKNELLALINQADFETVKKQDQYFSDYITKCDWYKRNEERRSWVQFFINDLWFQQYEKNSRHGWHVHGSAYTGVYYLELNKSDPLTEIIDPFNNNKKITIPANEGDIVIFPSGVIHQCPLLKKKTRKTIISFNIDPLFVEPKTLKKVESL